MTFPKTIARVLEGTSILGRLPNVRLSEYLTLAFVLVVLIVILDVLFGIPAYVQHNYWFTAVRVIPLFVFGLVLVVIPRTAPLAVSAVLILFALSPLFTHLPATYANTLYVIACSAVLVLLPNILLLWEWRMQLLLVSIIVLCSAVALFVMQGGVPVFGFLSLVSIGGASVYISKVWDARRQSRLRSVAALESVQSILPRSSFYPVAVLQGLFLVLLILFEQVGLEQRAPWIQNALALAVLFGAGVLFHAVRASRRALVVFVATVLVAFLISLASLETWHIHLGFRTGWLWTSLPLIFVAMSTAALPWSTAYQVVVALSVSVFGVVSLMLIQAPPDGTLSQAFWGVSLHSPHREHVLLLLAGATLSVFLARAVRQHRLIHFPQMVGPAYFRQLFSRADVMQGAEEVSPPELLPWSSQDGVLFDRMSQMLQGLFLVGFVACAGTSLLLTTTAAIFANWAVFVSLWVLVLFLARRNLLADWVGAFGAFTGLMLYLCPTSVILFLGIEDSLWLVFPLGIMLALSIIPWRLSEIIPIITTGVFVSLFILRDIPVGAGAYVALFAAACVSTLWAVRSLRETKEQYILRTFQEAIARARDSRDCLRILADFLLTLFDAHGALLRHVAGGHDVVRFNRAFTVPASASFASLHERVSAQVGQAHEYTSLLQMSDLDLFFFDARFGVFWAETGVLVTVSPQQFLSRGKVGGIAQVGAELPWIFIPLPTSFSLLLRRRERTIAETIVAQAVARLHMLSEQQRRIYEQARAEQEGARQEYEWNTVVHDINNTVQDISMICETAEQALRDRPEDTASDGICSDELSRIDRIRSLARSIAILVTDTNRRRELKRLPDLTPRELVSVDRVIENSHVYARVRADRRRVTVSFEFPESDLSGTAVRVSAKEHLETVFRGMLSNAIHTSHPGTTVQVTVDAGDEWLRVSVHDTGPGFSAEELMQLRERAATPPGRFTEFSFTDIQHFAQQQGGSFVVESRGPGHGTSVTLVLPRVEAFERERDTDDSAWALIVEDEPILSVMYTRIFKALGLKAVSTSTISEAREGMRVRDEPRIVLSDLHLADGGGGEWVAELRGVLGESIPILVVTGTDDANIRRQVLESGANEFVVKPVGQRELFALIHRVLEPAVMSEPTQQ